MTSFPVWLGVFLIGGFLVLGIFQSVSHEATPTGAALAGAAVLDIQEPLVVEEVPQGPSQEEINICMNECMNECVIDVNDNDPCRSVCEGFCNVKN